MGSVSYVIMNDRACRVDGAADPVGEATMFRYGMFAVWFVVTRIVDKTVQKINEGVQANLRRLNIPIGRMVNLIRVHDVETEIDGNV